MKEKKITEIEIRHHNDIAYGKLEDFELRELKLFFGLLSNVEENKLSYEYNSQEIKHFINMGDQSYKAFEKIIGNLQKRRILIKIDEDKYITYSIFSTLLFDKKEKKINVKYNSDFFPLISNFKANYCKYKLKNIEVLSSKYSIILYILSKANLYKEKYTLSINDVLEKIGKNVRTNNLDKIVINPAIQEINKYTDINIAVQKKYESQLRGRSKLTGYNFYVKKKEIIITDKLKKAVEKAEKNIYIKRAKVLNEQTLQILLEEIEEEKLIQGLKFSYSKINKEFTTLEYLKKVILTDEITTDKKEKKEIKNNVTETDFSEFKKNKILKKLNSLDEYERLKIEEKALKNVVEFENKNIEKMLKLKDKSPSKYWSILQNYIEL